MSDRQEGSQSEYGTKALKFAAGPSTTLALADKTDSLAATIRYDDEKGIQEGDFIRIVSAQTGDHEGAAEVTHTETVPVRRALDVVRMHWAEYGIQSIDRLVSELNDYYDDTIDLSSEVKVIILNPSLWGEQDGE